MCGMLEQTLYLLQVPFLTSDYKCQFHFVFITPCPHDFKIVAPTKPGLQKRCTKENLVYQVYQVYIQNLVHQVYRNW